jgi:hypothetical protein
MTEALPTVEAAQQLIDSMHDILDALDTATRFGRVGDSSELIDTMHQNLLALGEFIATTEIVVRRTCSGRT